MDHKIIQQEQTTIPPYFMNAVTDPDTGKKQEYRHLIKMTKQKQPGSKACIVNWADYPKVQEIQKKEWIQHFSSNGRKSQKQEKQHTFKLWWTLDKQNSGGKSPINGKRRPSQKFL